MMKFSAEAAKYLPDAEVIEAHSPQKEESPSGTGIRPAELISAARTKTPVECSDKELFHIYSREVLKQLSSGRGDWEKSLPETVVNEIVENKFFGFRG